MIEKMKEDRCGNADVVFGSDRDECTEKKVSFRGEILKEVTSFQIPGKHELQDVQCKCVLVLMLFD